MATLTYPTDADARAEWRREKAKLRLKRWRRIVLDDGPSHPEFGHAFMTTYLPHYMTDPVTGARVPPASWHPEFFQRVFGTVGTGAREITEAHRESAKSTISNMGVVLAALALELKHYVWIVQDTGEQAKQSMEAVLTETESNTTLRRDFPHLTPKLGKHNRPEVDRDTDVVFRNEQRLQALGAGMKLRGRRHRQHRPDLVIVDDLENDELVLTKYQRDKLDRWFSRALMGAIAGRADLYMLGTPLHHDALLRRLPKRARWNVARYPLLSERHRIDVDGQARYDPQFSTWPEWWTPQRILSKQGEVLAKDFAQEYLLLVVDEDDLMFPQTFAYGPRMGGDDVRVRIGVDSASSTKERKTADRSAIVVAMKRRRQARFHVDEAWADRVRLSGLKSKIVAVYNSYVEMGYAPTIVFETVQAQEWGKQELEDLGLPVEGVKPPVDKVTRAEPVALHYQEHRVTHAEQLRGTEFETEVGEFPEAEHDDYVDALVYAIRGLEVEKGMGVAGVVVADPTKKQREEWTDPRYA